MIGREELKRQTEAEWQSVKRAYIEGQNLDLHICRKDRGLLVTGTYSALPEVSRSVRIGTMRAVVVGVDVREWTRRSWAVQSMITAILYENIRRVCESLRKVGFLAEDQPSVISHTGDGAMLVFGCGEEGAASPSEGDQGLDRVDECPVVAGGTRTCQACLDPHRDSGLPIDVINTAMAFVYALNAMTQQDNFGERFKTTSLNQQGVPPAEAEEMEYLPVYLRYALTHGRVLPVIGVLGQLECVGEPMVTCNRILSTDHGNHLLVSRGLLREIDRHGGLLELGRGNPAFDWKHVLYVAEMSDKLLKYGRFRYADVFGYHDDGPLLSGLGETVFEPRRYQIGSHDVRMVE